MKKGRQPMRFSVSSVERMSKGFTIIELLIAIVLMIIILAAIAFVFAQSAETVNIGEARMEVYTNARYALDFLEQDLQNMLAFDGRQEFLMSNGWYAFNSNGDIAASRTGPSNSGASIPSVQWMVHVGVNTTTDRFTPADVVEFKTIVSYDDQQQLARVRYKLESWETIVDPDGPPLPDYLRHWTRTIKSRRPIFAFVRDLYIWSQDLNNFEFIRRQELCHYALGFNVEYFAKNARFSQIDLPSNLFSGIASLYDVYKGSPCPYYTNSYPLGDNDPDRNSDGYHNLSDGVNDTPESALFGAVGTACSHCGRTLDFSLSGTQPGTPFRIPYIRVTLQVLEGVAERQERVITKVIWIPVG